MAATLSWKTIQNFLWLLFAAVCLFLALVLWALNFKQPEVVEIEPEKQAQEAVRPVKNETVAFDTQLGTFITEVPALVLQQRVVAAGDRAPEFRGSKFISENTKSWSLQLMAVTEEDIIKSYLDKREDRNKFQYFRLQAEGQPEQFVLTYGIFKDVNEVLDKTKVIRFDLPDQIKNKPEKFSTYSNLINDLGYDELSTGTKLRPITLTKAALPVIPVLRPAVPSSATTRVEEGVVSTEIKRRETPVTSVQDKKTETVSKAEQPTANVQERRTSPSTKPQAVEQQPQVVDPFN